MKFRLAKMDDLPRLKAMYRKIVQSMEEQRIGIWDDVFPCEFLQGDIEKNCLYLAEDGSPAAAFALLADSDGASAVQWEDPGAKAYYINRLGVDVGHVRQGIGGLMLRHAMSIAREKGAGYLRLFVVDINAPAINLYEKSGFRRAGGVYEEVIDEDLVLREYGFEIRL
ncbi:MAG: GNAT family N-acetyltransferase [Oscillospiraceae bacterium]|nr:GNAT family N-acetyltransferase [Oscillospiraceae bacterium]